MKKIAFDVMGNDNGIEAAVSSVVEFTSSNSNYQFILIGDKKEILNFTKETELIKIIDAPVAVNKKMGIREARKNDTSMKIAIDLVKDKKADVVISSGDSAIYLSIATLNLKRLNGIKRPAFMPVFPTIKKGKRFVFVDAGANLESTPEMLSQWAKLGTIFAENILHVKKPKVGLVNIGTEENKGKDFHKETNEILKKDKSINYISFVEPRSLLNAVVDVAVIDGYAGNMVLKSMEGTIVSLLSLIKNEIKTKTKYKIGYLLSKGAFNNIKNTLDYRNVGSAWIIGLNGLAIKCHGGADKMSYLGAFKQIHESLQNDLMKKMKEAFNE